MIERYSRPEMSAVWSEKTKYGKWLEVEIAACEAWSELGIVPAEALPEIRRAQVNIDRLNAIMVETHHDVTAFLKSVGETIGPEGRFIHYGMTSSDVVDTGLSLQLVTASDLLMKGLLGLTEAIEKQARKHKKTVMVGRTHGVHAEPTTFGLKMAIWVSEMRRNIERLMQAKKAVAVGKISGAVGTYATVPPKVEEMVCKKLGISAEPVSNQVVQRDRHAQFVTTLALIASSLEKFAQEIRALQKTETLEAEEPFEEGQTGSSAMPHKRNPELCERVCGLARVIRGNALTSMQNIALWHERDISHSSTERIILPDSCLLLDYMLSIFTYVMKDLKVYPEHMQRSLGVTNGLVFSQRVLTALIEKGLGRQEAYKMVQRNAMVCWKEKTSFLELLSADSEVISVMSKDELAPLFDYNYYMRHVDEIFARLDL
ncbi:MAG: adenylosuccinate lyase [Chloroflexi bacterium]|jgi:adenylosuccinate lyase|nr:adenylosuccinate lyase [Chloroflexota bacterium]MBT7080762.1 adenylosuccinate lyase [Chloroflexota bacterium]MBT7289565.1 adenylosuccinate lyase [Chloroflexota bacterium]